MNHPDNSPEGFRVSHTWDSFEELRVKYVENLAQLEEGIAGRLYVKRNAYVIVNEADFDKLQKLLSDVRELRIHVETLSKTMVLFKNLPGTGSSMNALIELLDHAIGAITRTAVSMLHHVTLAPANGGRSTDDAA